MIKFSDYYSINSNEKVVEVAECQESNSTLLQNPSGSPIIEIYKKFCLCASISQKFELKSDLLKTDLNFLQINIFAKQKIFEFDYEQSTIFFVNRNTYFDYSKKDSAINSYFSPVIIKPKLMSSIFSVYFNKIKYKELIDFDIFYKQSNENEDYTISDTVERENGKAFKASEVSQVPMISVLLFAGNTIYNYDITLISIDTILATFSGVFQVLSMILGFIGNFYNNFFFDIEIDKRLFKYKGVSNEGVECLKEFYQRRKNLRAENNSNFVNEHLIEVKKLKEIDSINSNNNNNSNKLCLKDNEFIKEDELD